MLKKCSSKCSFLSPNWCKIRKIQFWRLKIFSFWKKIFLEWYIDYYVKLYHYTRIILHNKNTKINYLPYPTAMEKLAVERNGKKNPILIVLPWFKLFVLLLFLNIRLYFSFGWINSKKNSTIMIALCSNAQWLLNCSKRC